jgi:hypothetical protein
MTNFNIYGGETILPIPTTSDNPLIDNLFRSTYKDDFSDSAGYHRVLFNSGKSVQARELTQLQTIIQREMSRFGNNIFKEGAAVNPGGITVTAYDYVKVTGSGWNNNTSILLRGGVITGANGAVAKILDRVNAIGDDPNTLYITYTSTPSGSGGADTTTPPKFQVNEVLSVVKPDGGSVELTCVNEAPSGQGLVASSAAGDFFVEGHFVFAHPHSIIISKYSATPTAVIGFRIIQDIVTVAETNDLYDNQGALPNFTSPGADRYRIRLQLADQATIDSDTNFVYVAKIRDGAIVTQVEGDEGYNKILDLMALRTKEESGDYIVKPFNFSVTQDSALSPAFNVKISSGVAYVNGYRATHSDEEVRFLSEKPVSVVQMSEETIPINYGNYVLFSVQKGLPNITTFPTVNLYAAIGGSGTVIGTCRIRSVARDGSNYRAYLFDIKMITTKNFRLVRSIGSGTSDYIDPLIATDYGQPTLRGMANHSLLFPMPRVRSKVMEDVDLFVMREFNLTASSNSVTVSVSASGESLTQTASWIVADADGDILSGFTVTVNSSTSITLSGDGSTLPDGATTIMAIVKVGDGVVRSKTLTSATVAVGLDSDGSGNKWVPLNRADIFSVDRVRLVDSDGIEDKTSLFDLDNGQRDNFYSLGRLLLKPGLSAPAGNIFARFTHFAHGAGDFFAINSYAAGPNYGAVPKFRKNTAETVSLRDVLDFRPVQDSNGQYPAANINQLPLSGTLVTSDTTYYQGRKDKIIINEKGIVSIIKGNESLDPQFPDTSSMTGVLELHSVEMNPNTLHINDLRATRSRARHYTMADIGDIEDDLVDLKRTTALSLLETNTANWQVFDSDGLSRTKSGFLVDNFKNYSMSDNKGSNGRVNPNYRAAVDPQQGRVRPSFVDNNIKMHAVTELGSNVVQKGDNIYLAYTHEVEVSQPICSGTENVNPFQVTTGTGNLEISPTIDSWKSKSTIEDVDNPISTSFDTSGALFWNEAEFSWHGTGTAGDVINRRVARASGNRSIRGNTTALWPGTVTTTTTNRIDSIEVDRELVSHKRVEHLTEEPIFCRSRRVFFQATGLRSNTRFFPFLDQQDVSSWCKMESQFLLTSGDALEYGDQGTEALTSPYGSTTLQSNSNGTLTGSLYVPNQSIAGGLRFLAGQPLRFSLLDISEYNPELASNQATAEYRSSGIIEKWQNTYQTTRTVKIKGSQTETFAVRRVDPLAQSIHIEDGDGYFVTKVDIFFATKPAEGNTVVMMEIRPLVNGVPSSEEFLASVSKAPSAVNVSLGPNLSNVQATSTTFELDEPIYLSPGQGYAIVLLSDALDYNVYVASTGEFELGSTTKKITSQPHTGSLFLSQNGKTWEPSQNRDMMFKLYSAKFNTAGGYQKFYNLKVPAMSLRRDPFQMDSGDNTVYVQHPNNGFKTGRNDTVTISRFLPAGGASAEAALYNDVRFGGMTWAGSIEGTHEVTQADGHGYFFEADSAATSTGQFGGRGMMATHNAMFDIIRPEISNMNFSKTSMLFESKLTQGSSLAGQIGTYELKETSYSTLDNEQWNYFPSPKVILETDKGGLYDAQAFDERSIDLKVTLSTTSDKVSPVIDLQNASMTYLNNIIDRPDENATVGFNNPVLGRWVPETSPTGGTTLAKHITSPVVLAQDAVGINVFLAVMRPAVTEVFLYYRVAGDGDVLSDQSWIKHDAIVDPGPSEGPDDFREYEYLIGGQNGEMLPFTEFQLKIVFTSTNSVFVPMVRDLRAIALAV